MSDLIHEGPKDPNKPPVPGEEKPTTERERMKKVYTYVAILFTVAFLLILWTFLMNQRSINEIKDGNTALQSTLQQNDSLEAHIAELEEQLANSEEDKKLSTRPSAFSPTSCARSTGCLRSKTPTTPAISTPRKTTSARSRRPARWNSCPRSRCVPVSPATTPPPPPRATSLLWTSCFRTA